MWRWSTLGWKDGYLEGRWEKRLNTMTGGSMLWMKSLSGAGRCQNEGMGAGCHYNEVRITLQSFQTLRIPRHLFSQGTCPTAAVFHEHAARNFVEAPQTIPSQSLETAEGRKLAGSWLPVSSGIIRYGIQTFFKKSGTIDTNGALYLRMQQMAAPPPVCESLNEGTIPALPSSSFSKLFHAKHNTVLCIECCTDFDRRR